MEQGTRYLCLGVLLEEGSGGKVCLQILGSLRENTLSEPLGSADGPDPGHFAW